MFVVAVMQLTTPLEAEAAALATDLGRAPYEVRLSLAAGFPALVLSTPDRDRATALLTKIRARGQGAVAFDDTAVVARADMISMRRFRFDPSGVVAETPGKDELLPYGDVLALIRAVHKRHVETTTEVKEKKFSAGRAFATGGLLMSKKTSREVSSVTDDREQLLYLFRRSGASPWLLSELGTHYTALAADLAPTTLQNFTKTIERLRISAPQATYDDRLMTAKKIPERPARSLTTKTLETSDSDGVDLLAHSLALWLSRTTTTPYRS